MGNQIDIYEEKEYKKAWINTFKSGITKEHRRKSFKELKNVNTKTK